MSVTADLMRPVPPPPAPAPRRRPLRRPSPTLAEHLAHVRPRVVLSMLSLLLVLAGSAWLMQELGRHPISSVRIAADFRQLDRGELEAAIQPHLVGSFFAVDVDVVRRAASALPWVREASVRRVWPGSIHVAIVERVAAYRWNDSGLLETDGALFEPVKRGEFARLPQLGGPPGTHAEVVAMHERIGALMEPVGQRLVSLSVSARGAWRARLSGGIGLVMGREPDMATLQRLARAFPAVLAGQQERIETIDLRYANGFAVRWKPLDPDQQPASESQG